MPETDPYKRIEELESENRLLHAEIKRLRGALDLPPDQRRAIKMSSLSSA